MQDSVLHSSRTSGLDTILCHKCERHLDPLDRFCRYCGMQRDKQSPVHHKPLVVLSLLFLIIGPLALPLLWRSDGFTRNQKIGITVANLAFIAAIMAGMLLLVGTYMKMILDLSGV